MRQTDRMIYDFLDLEQQAHADDIIFQALRAKNVRQTSDKQIELEVPFTAFEKGSFNLPEERQETNQTMTLRRYGDKIMRLSLGKIPVDEENVMLDMHESLKLQPLKASDLRDDVNRPADFIVEAADGKTVATIGQPLPPTHNWSDIIVPALDELTMSIYPDARHEMKMMAYDTFTPTHRESIGLGFATRQNETARWLFAHYAAPDEKFAGTGERFMPLNLSGKTMVLENTDALGVNSRRAYKNVPFYLSSRGYGVLIMSSAQIRLSLADISTRAAQTLVEDDYLDVFILGGEDLADIIHQYHLLTGFPAQTPLWSYGMWMSRMTYFSADETLDIARKLREGDYPCDVLHLDTGWFRKDWQCEWAFNPDKFPDPPAYFQEMKDMGYRITLWQNPSIAKDTLHYDTAIENRYVAPIKEQTGSESDFGGIKYGGNIDFSNPEAYTWYQGLLKNLLDMGAAAIKTDFGEKINENADYYGIPYKRLRNLYSLLYQKAAYDITRETTGDGIIWARAGWIGCQRYPIHWGGDCACSWDGLAGTIRGGLHIGLTGFAFWSHDVPGFHGLPEFMNHRPSDNLYVRWTQAGIFGSHLRYHGTSAREPYEYPAVSDLVRSWLKLRYALIPYLYEQGEKGLAKGLPVMRALVFHHEADPIAWQIDDAFYCGDDLLIAPVMSEDGCRQVYLPEGSWVDFWTGDVLQGGRYLPSKHYPLAMIPIFVRQGATLPYYPEAVACTDDMDLSKTSQLVFDNSYQGFMNSPLQKITGLTV